MNIISASRRTDIPAFYVPWLMNRLRAGAVRYPNPFSGELGTVPLQPERCYFSFATFYGKVIRQLRQAGIRYRDPPLDEKRALTATLADIAGEYGMALYACCQDALVTGRVQKAHCVDGNLLAQLFLGRPRIDEARPTLEQCGCTASRDIGMYDTCPFGCVYCYANKSPAAAQAR